MSWEESAELMFSKASKDDVVVKWADLLDFYIQVDKERSKATIFQPIHHDGDFKAAQHSRWGDYDDHGDLGDGDGQSMNVQ